MLIMKIFFLILTVICIIFYVMYLWDFALILLITIIAVQIVMFVSTYITKKLINIEFSVKEDTVMKNEEFPVLLKITNRSIFPVGKAEAFIEYYNIFNNEINTFNLLLPIQARNSQSISFQLNSKYCGIIRVRCAYVSIYDPLRLFEFKTGKNIHEEIAVMPECHEINGQICSYDKESEESSVFSEFKAGDDPSEIFDLREYHQGDKLNRIHWKLSSKKDDFIVKDYSLPIDVPCMLFLDLSIKSKYTLPILDTLIETLISVSQFMLENERLHSIVYCDSGTGEFIEKDIGNTDELSALTYELILSLNNNSGFQPVQNYFAEKNNLSLSSFVFITSNPDPSVIEYIDENIEADIKNAVAVVTSPNAVAGIPPNNSDFNIIPVVIGRITSSIKDIEL